MSYPKYPDYSKTLVELVPAIPRHWSLRRMKFSVSKVGSGVTPKGGSESYESEGIPLLRSQNIHFDGLRLDDVVFISDETHQQMNNSQVHAGDVLINITGASIGRCHYFDGELGEANVNQHVCIIRPESFLLTRFLYYVLRSDLGQQQINLEQSGSGREGLNFEMLKNFVVPFVDPNEQQQIAAFLDWKTGQIDTLIARKKELMEKLKEKRLAVITQAATRGLDPSAPLRDSGISWLGQVPEHWEVIPLGFLMTMSGGMTPSMAKSEYWEGDIPWVTPKDMKVARISDSLDHVTEEALIETSLALIPVKSVLVVVRGMILAHSFPTAVTESPVTINQDMKAIRCDEKLEVEYLFWCFTGFAKVFSDLAQESAHGTRKMETETIKKFPMPIPPVEEQRAIAVHVKASMDKLDQLADATRNTIERLTEYRTALITAATTGKIDVRGVKIPAAKPALRIGRK